jgi:hypothetical protein
MFMEKPTFLRYPALLLRICFHVDPDPDPDAGSQSSADPDPDPDPVQTLPSHKVGF